MLGPHCPFVSTHYTAASPGRRERDRGVSGSTTPSGSLCRWEDVLCIIAEGLFRDQCLGTEGTLSTRRLRRDIRARRLCRAFICGVLLPIRAASRSLHRLASTSFGALVSDTQDDAELEWSLSAATAAIRGVEAPGTVSSSSSDGDTSSERAHAASAVSPPPDDRSFHIVGGQRWHRAGHLHESG